MELSQAIENIVTKVIADSGFGFEDQKQEDDFKTIIRDICRKELEPLYQLHQQSAATAATATPAPQFIQPQMVRQTKKRNGYNLFIAELRQNLVVTTGSEEAAKKEFNRLGGVTTYCNVEWNKLDDAAKKVYNDRAKAERMVAVAPTAIPVGTVPIGVVAKRPPNKWQRFQAAFGKQLKAQNDAKKAANEPVEAFANIGQHTTACSTAYQLIKDDKDAINAYFAQWSV